MLIRNHFACWPVFAYLLALVCMMLFLSWPVLLMSRPLLMRGSL